MVNMMQKAQQSARKAVESTYTGTCTIIAYRNEMDAATKITGFNDVAVLENQPCKLSFENIDTVSQGENSSDVRQVTKLFIAPEIQIMPGSKIIVEQNGRRQEYELSGIPAVYCSHQEIMLEAAEEKA